MKIPNTFHIQKIIEAGIKRDPVKVVAYAQQLAQKLESAYPTTAQKILEVLNKKEPDGTARAEKFATPLPVDGESRFALADHEVIEKGSVHLFLPDSVQTKLQEFLSFAENVEKLTDAGLSPVSSLILHGPPGVGKTLLARYIASETQLSLLTARADALVSSHLGSTAKSIRRLFEYATKQPCVLFLDEIDSIAKMRDDQYEVGELKRVVISLLQNIDTTKEQIILIAATNHPHLLDPALWRRFDYSMQLDLPDEKQRSLMFTDFLKNRIPKSDEFLQMATKVSNTLSGSTLKQVTDNAIRLAVIRDQQEVTEKDILSRLIDARFNNETCSYDDRIAIVKENLAPELTGSELTHLLAVIS